MHGEDTSCKKTNTYCPELWYVTDNSGWTKFETLAQHIAPKYGEYVDLYSTITFTEEQLSPTNAYYAMMIYGLGTLIYLVILFSLSSCVRKLIYNLIVSTLQ